MRPSDQVAEHKQSGRDLVDLEAATSQRPYTVHGTQCFYSRQASET